MFLLEGSFCFELAFCVSAVFATVYLSVCLSVCPSVCLFVCLFVCLSVCLSVSLYVFLSVILFARLPACLSAFLSIFLFISSSLQTVFLPYLLHFCPVCMLLLGWLFIVAMLSTQHNFVIPINLFRGSDLILRQECTLNLCIRLKMTAA